MSDATIFSQSRRLVFAEPVTRTAVERLLHDFLLAVGEPLSYNGVILGHIKAIALLPAGDDFLFLSLTRLDHVDIKASPAYWQKDNENVDCIELTLNVLVFGYSKKTIEKVVDAALAILPLMA